MTTLNTVRRFFWALTMILSFAVFVLTIDYISESRTWLGTYGPALPALLVASLLHTLWYFYLIINGKAHRALTILAGILFVWTFYLATLIAFTVLRNKPRYCPSENITGYQCGGLNRGILAVGWANIGIGLFAVGTLFAVVSKYGHWSDELRHLPAKTGRNGALGHDLETGDRTTTAVRH